MNDIDQGDSAQAPQETRRTVGKNRRGTRKHQILIMATEEEKMNIKAEARRHGLTVAGLIRAALASYRGPVDPMPDCPISDLPVAVLDTLALHGIRTWRHLFFKTEEELTAWFSAEALSDIREAVRRTGYKFGMTVEEIDRRARALSEIFSLDVAGLGLSTRTVNTLYMRGARTLGDLCAISRHVVERFRGFGRKGLAELDELLKTKGVALGMIVPGHGV